MNINVRTINTLNYLNIDIPKVVIPPKKLNILKEFIDSINNKSNRRNYKLNEHDIENKKCFLYKNNLKNVLLQHVYLIQKSNLS